MPYDTRPGPYSPNVVTSSPYNTDPESYNAGWTNYGGPSYGYTPQGGSAFDASYGPAAGGTGGFDTKGAASNPAAASQGDASGGGAGSNVNMWVALANAFGGKLEAGRQAKAAALAAQNDIPADPSYLRPFLDQMAIEGMQLRDSQLGARGKAEAAAAGHRAAASRGLSGPLAASVENDSVSRAQDRYNQWRMGALNAFRQQYIDRMSQYVNAMQARRQALLRAGYAGREAKITESPFIGPIGQWLARTGSDNNWQFFDNRYNKNNIEAAANDGTQPYTYGSF